MHITILGRQPALGVAELERLYGSDAVRWFSDMSATVDSPQFDFNHLGGTQKAGKIVAEISGNWRTASMRIIKDYSTVWANHEGKITLGISTYGISVTPREVQKTGIILKGKLKQHGVSMRLIPNIEPALNTATSHHNKLGLSSNHVELLVVRGANGKVIIAESVGAQNITAIAARDQARPKTDSFVGMLPPKLARMMVNIASGTSLPSRYSDSADSEGSAFPAERDKTNSQLASSVPETKDTSRAGDTKPPTILDPFCGTGVLLQEAMLLGYAAHGTDLSEKMVDYSQQNLNWLTSKFEIRNSKFQVTQGDAMDYKWPSPIDAVATETYLGQPFSAPPSPAKLQEVRGNCNHIVSTFLLNIGSQITPGTPLCVAVPAWRDTHGNFTHLPFINSVGKLGYKQISLKHVTRDQLLYYRENQVVARELLLLEKT